MNLDEFRALKAQEADAKTQTEQPAQQAIITQQPQITEQVAPVVNTIKLGEEEVTEDQIKEWKAGYSRTQDYTRKTQEVSALRKEAHDAIKFYDDVRKNPQIINTEYAQQNQLDPASQRIAELENSIMDMRVQGEVNTLSSKYSDFDVQKVIEVAMSKNLNLEDAYHVAKGAGVIATNSPPAVSTPQLDIEEIKKQLRVDLLNEIQKTNNSTTSIISTGGAIATQQSDDKPLSDAELDYCKRSNTNPVDYARWKKNMKQ